jgi:glycosyltransferase involved in cell wall biosynthesis
VLHSHGYKVNILLGFLPKFVRRLPIVATLHGWTNTGRATKLQFYEWLDGRSVRHLDAGVLVSGSMLSNYRLRNCEPSRVHVVQNGIRVSENGAMDSKPLRHGGLDPAIADFCRSGLTIGSIGRLSPEKGYPALLKAVWMLVTGGLDVRLAILGDGPQKAVLQAEARRLDIASRLLLPGYCSGAADYLPLFAVFVLPSRTECLPLTILEAMRAGVPVVASRVGGIPEILRNGEAGLLVDPQNAGELAASIYRLTSDRQLRRRLCDKERSIVRNCYSLEAMAAKYQLIYKSLVKSFP